MKKLLTLALLAVSIYGQEKKTADEELVTVPKKYVSSQGLEHQSVSDQTSKWIGIGHEIGVATREGLNSVVDVADKFGHTNVGMFVMVMVAWKIIGRDLLLLFVGVPVWIAIVFVWVWTCKRLFFGYRVLAKQEGRVKEYRQEPAMEFASNDARAAVGVGMFGFACGLVIVLFVVIL